MISEHENIKDNLDPTTSSDTAYEDKLFNKIDGYTTKLSDAVDKYTDRLFTYEKFIHYTVTIGKKTINYISFGKTKFLGVTGEINYFIADTYTKMVTHEQTYNIARWTTVPYNWLWFQFLKRQTKKLLPLYEPGTHFGYALQGGGKSSLAFNIMEYLRLTTGYGSYVNVELEKPRWDPINQFWYKLHQNFSELDYWGLQEKEDNLGNPYFESTQLMKFDTKLFRNVFIDELFSLFNQRENKKSEYNNVFIGLMKSIVHQRHAEVERYYFFSQISRTDVQLHSIFKWVHQIKVILDCKWWDWVRNGKLDKHIIGWLITSTSETKDRKGRDTIIAKRYFIPRIFDEEYFETKNMKHLYDHLPVKEVLYTRGAIS